MFRLIICLILFAASEAARANATQTGPVGIHHALPGINSLIKNGAGAVGPINGKLPASGSGTAALVASPGLNPMLSGTTLATTPSSSSPGTEIVSDGTLGKGLVTFSNTNNTYTIPSTVGMYVGTQVQGNLFESFSQFGLSQGETAIFQGPVSVQNLIARVTGGSQSSIDGTIKSDISGANLFLLNPKGVMFGPNAQLDVGGSFAVSTANYVKLSDGVRFGRFNAYLGDDSMLSSAPVSAFGFLNSGPASVSISGSSLGVTPQKCFSIIAGDISIDGARIIGQGSRINLVSVSSPGEVQLDASNLNSTVDVTQFAMLGQISISNFSRIDTGGFISGPVVIRSGQFVLNSSQILSENFGPLTGASLDITTLESLQIIGGELSTNVWSAGEGGDMTVRAGSLSITNGGAIRAEAKAGTGNAGSLSINVDGDLELLNGGTISSHTESAGRGGDVTIYAGSLTIDGPFFTGIATNSLGGAKGDAGNLDLTVGGDMVLAGIVTSETASIGDAGAMNLTVGGNLTVNANGHIATDTSSGGHGGTMTIHSGSLIVNGGRLTAQANNGATGDAGNLNLTIAGQLSVTGVGQISTNTTSAGHGGDINIQAGSMSVDNAGVSAEADTGATNDAGRMEINVSGALDICNSGTISAHTESDGRGGDIVIHADSLTINGVGAQFFTGIAADTGGTGAAGSLDIQVDGGMAMKGAVISANTTANTSKPGDGGAVNVHAGSLSLDGAGIFAETDRGTKTDGTGGAGGSLNVNVDGLLEISGGGSISTHTETDGRAGDITVNASSLTIDATNAGFTGIASNSGGRGDAGNIDITVSGQTDIKNGGSIAADTKFEGAGGNITILSGDLIVDGGSIGTSTEGTGNGGNISITANSVSLENQGAISATSSTAAPAGSITLGSLQSPLGMLSIDSGSSISTANTGAGNAGSVSIATVGAMELSGGGSISTFASSGNGGDVTVQTANLTLSDESTIDSTSFGSGNGGNISVTANSISIDSNTNMNPFNVAGIFAESSGSARGGDITIRTRNLTITGAPISGAISSSTNGSGDGGNIEITAESILVNGGGPGFDNGIIAVAGPGSTGNGGDVTVIADSLTLANGGIISTDSYSPGRAGSVRLNLGTLNMNGGSVSSRSSGFLSSGVLGGGAAGSVSVTATGPVELSDNSRISTDAGGLGNAGDVKVQTPILVITGGSEISSDTFGQGNGGKVSVVVADSLSLQNQSRISAESSASGAAGSVGLTLGTLNMSSSSSISSANSGTGDAGSVSIATTGSMELSGDSSVSTSAHGGTAGDVIVHTSDLGITQGAEISSSTFGGGSGGDIKIAADSISVEGTGSAISAEADAGTGSGGEVNITSSTLLMENDGSVSAKSLTGATAGSLRLTLGTLKMESGSFISSANTGSGEAGNVVIDSTGSVKLKHRSSISTSSALSGAGNIELIADGEIKLSSGSSIMASAGTDGGGITVKAPVLVSLVDSNIKATAGIKGGNITIDPIALRLRNSTINASAGSQGGHIDLFTSFLVGPVEAVAPDGRLLLAFNSSIAATGGTSNGTINLTAPALDLGAELITLPDSLVSAANQLQERCTALLQGDFSSFISIGRGGTEPEPDELETEF